MKALLTALIFLSFGFTTVLGQGMHTQVADSRVRQLMSMGPNSTPVHGFDTRTSDLKGSPYLFNKWMKGEITTHSGKNIDSLEINYDIMNHMVEIKVNKYVKAASEAEIDGFSISDEGGQKRTFISVSDLRLPGEKLVGFAEVLFEGSNINLLKKYEIKYIEPNYVEHFDVGSLDAELVKKEKYFLLIDGKLEEFNKRKSFGEKRKQVKTFIRKNDLDLRKERDLIYAVEYYNSLL